MAATDTVTGTIAGFFEDHSDAEKAVRALQDAGFASAHMGVAHRGNDVTSTGYDSNETVGERTSDAAHAVGQKGEGMWDKVKDFFGGNEAEPYAGERSEGDLGTREITPSGSDSRYGYGAGDLHGTLQGVDVPESRSRYFDHRFGSSDNGAVVTVKAGNRAADAERILKQYGADLGDTADTHDFSAAAAPTTTPTQTNDVRSNEGVQNIQLLGEMLRVHKDRISRGEVRMHKETITEMQTIQVPVSREELVIERHSVDGGTQVHGSIGDNSEIRIPLTEERAGVDKSTFVREEVSVGKRAVESTQELSDQVRHEELVVEDNTRNVTNDVTKTGR